VIAAVPLPDIFEHVVASVVGEVMSTSGMEIRSGLRKRSKRRSYLIGSIFVMPVRYATNEPAADPRPGPTTMPLSFAQFTKSWTMRKYDANPVRVMTSSS